MKPQDVIIHLKESILVDGYHIVADLEKSHGSWIVDAITGREYLDCYSQFASQPIGWNHPKMGEIDKSLFANKMANSDMYSQVYGDFVKAFSEATEGFSHYFFIDSGALAVENAIKAAFDWKAQKRGWKDDQYTNELDVIHLKEAFHGRTGYTLSLTNTGELKTRWFPKFNWTRIVNPKTQHTDIELWEHKSLEQAEMALNNRHVAAIITEVVQGEGGDNHFRPNYFKSLRELADKYEALLVFDEVQTGMGLTGRMWAHEHTGVLPDLMCFGKKTQVCGFCSTGRIDEVPNNVFRQSGRINSTWGGNLIDMERCRRILGIMKEDNLVQNARAVGGYFLTLLSNLELKNLRGKGLMIAFDLDSMSERDKVLGRLKNNLLALKCGEKSIRFRPPLTFSRKEAEQSVNFLSKCL